MCACLRTVCVCVHSTFGVSADEPQISDEHALAVAVVAPLHIYGRVGPATAT